APALRLELSRPLDLRASAAHGGRSRRALLRAPRSRALSGPHARAESARDRRRRAHAPERGGRGSGPALPGAEDPLRRSHAARGGGAPGAPALGRAAHDGRDLRGGPLGARPASRGGCAGDEAMKARAIDVPTRESLLRIVDRFRGRKVAVIGDLVLDEYWVGRSSRISREAPVLILEHEGDRHVPG